MPAEIGETHATKHPSLELILHEDYAKVRRVFLFQRLFNFEGKRLVKPWVRMRIF
jgi:hypothetical protein